MSDKNTNDDKYLSYNGRLAETLVKTFFEKHDYIVHNYGIENTLGQISKIFDYTQQSDKSKDTAIQYMTAPDFIVSKIDKTNKQIKQSFLIEVKYRELGDYDDFNEENRQFKKKLVEQAEKYKSYWNKDVRIFLIVKYPQNVHAYYGSVEYIIQNKNISCFTCTKVNVDYNQHLQWIVNNNDKDKKILSDFQQIIKRVFL